MDPSEFVGGDSRGRIFSSAHNKSLEMNVVENAFFFVGKTNFLYLTSVFQSLPSEVNGRFHHFTQFSLQLAIPTPSAEVPLPP